MLSGIRKAYFFLTAFDFEFAFAFFLSAGAILYRCRLVLVEPQTNAQRRVDVWARDASRSNFFSQSLSCMASIPDLRTLQWLSNEYHGE